MKSISFVLQEKVFEYCRHTEFSSMEELTTLLLQTVSSQSQDEIAQAQERLDAYGMSPEFVSLLFEIITNSENDDNLRLTAGIYISVKCQAQWCEIPEESTKFILENFPNVFSNANEQMLSYFTKLSYFLSSRGYVSVIQESLGQFLQLCGTEETTKGGFIILKSISKAAFDVVFDKSDDASQHPSIVFLGTALPMLKQAFDESSDLFVLQKICGIMHYLLASANKLRSKGNEDLIAFYVDAQSMLEHAMEILVEGFDDEKFLCEFIKFAKEYAFVPPSALNEELITAVFERIIAVSSKSSSSKVICNLLQFLESRNEILDQIITSNINDLVENIFIPIFTLSSESVELVSSDPVRFAAENSVDVYLRDKKDMQSSCYNCIVSLSFRHDELKESIMQVAHTALENFSSDSDSAALYSLLSFCFCGYNSIASRNVDSLKEFVYSAAPLLEVDDELARCAFLYLVSGSSKHVIDADLFLAILSQFEVDSDLVKYYACCALESTIKPIIDDPEQQAAFIEGFSIDVSDFIETIFTLAHDYGDPELVGIIAHCTTLSAFQSSIVEIAPDIISTYFTISESFFEKSDHTNEVFQGLTHLLEVVKDTPVIEEISSQIATEIFQHQEYFSTNLKYALVDLISNNIAYSPTVVDEYWSVARLLMQLYEDDKSPDFKESVFIIIHNLIIKSGEGVGENLEWLIQLVHEMLANEKGTYALNDTTNLLSALLVVLPDDNPEKESLLQESFGILSREIEGVEMDEEDEIDVGSLYLDESFTLFDTVITLFPEQTVAAFGDNIFLLIGSYSYFCLYDIQQLSSVASVAKFVSDEMRFKIISSIIKELSPESLFKLNDVTDYYKDNSIDRPVVLFCIPMEERREFTITFFQEHAEAENEMAAEDGTILFLEKYFKAYPGAEEGEEE